MTVRPGPAVSRAIAPGAASAILALLALVLFPAGAGATAQDSRGKTKWLCAPAAADDPCRVGLRSTLIGADGTTGETKSPDRSSRRGLDCFYVYPTVSDQTTQNANRDVDPELESIALYQAARYNQHCRVFAPVYRQVTLAELGANGFTEEALAIAYRDVRRAWREYRDRRGPRRGVVLIGHSQGTYMLQRLVAEEIDPRRGARRRLIAAILLGGNVTVAEGSDRGGSFERVPACESARQLGCVIAFSTFNDTVPPDAIFGRASAQGEEVLCANPAALGGGSGRLRSLYPSEPFAPGTSIGLGTGFIGLPSPDVGTPWIEAKGLYRGACSRADDASVLQIEARGGAPDLVPFPHAGYGLHLADANIALGNLATLVGKKARKYRRTRR